MPNTSARDAEGVRFADDAARQLLARAIELDAKRSSEFSLAQLRDVATEAGISRVSFDTALSELQAAPATRVQSPRPLRRALAVAGLVFIALTAILVLARVTGRAVPAEDISISVPETPRPR